MEIHLRLWAYLPLGDSEQPVSGEALVGAEGVSQLSAIFTDTVLVSHHLLPYVSQWKSSVAP